MDYEDQLIPPQRRVNEGSEISTVERAFQLARTGACHSVNDIRERLLREGHANVVSHTSGMSIKKQLNAILAARGVTRSAANEDDEISE
ncbi:hypothetical protein [Sphingomonas sp. Leaf37]|uniref:hypothetical protein n=1 Tax=Sphingomonas sp. Leaf37 TaxID=2876552 RepID=UPI001E4B8F3E|nr:hypothetical protein [Sphingomonas sp. Leaf37]